MNCSCSTMAKPAVFAVKSVARRSEPVAIPPQAGHRRGPSRTSGSANKKCKSPGLVPDLNCSSWAPEGVEDAGGAASCDPCAAQPDLRGSRGETFAGAGDKMSVSSAGEKLSQTATLSVCQSTGLSLSLCARRSTGALLYKYPHKHTNP